MLVLPANLVSFVGRLFRKAEADEYRGSVDAVIERDERLARIRCPKCRWRPSKSSRWTCWDCDHPEYFYNGCGSAWNTFETEGLCPTCGHQWEWTACLSCAGWSRHGDWYE